jgi:hypothetical protein
MQTTCSGLVSDMVATKSLIMKAAAHIAMAHRTTQDKGHHTTHAAPAILVRCQTFHTR